MRSAAWSASASCSAQRRAQGLGPPDVASERGDARSRPLGALSLERLAQRRIGAEQVVVDERRNLIDDVVSRVRLRESQSIGLDVRHPGSFLSMVAFPRAALPVPRDSARERRDLPLEAAVGAKSWCDRRARRSVWRSGSDQGRWRSPAS
jgi:hypothetical protein